MYGFNTKGWANLTQAETQPVLPSAELQDLVLWGSRAKDADGLDHGYWEPWGPPCDLQRLESKECLSTFSTWLVKQLRSHRDATAQVAARLQKLQRSLFDEDAGKVTFEAAVAMILELPERLKSVEDSTQTLLIQVNKNRDDQLKRASTRVNIPAVKAAQEFEIHDKPVEQAVKECREAVNVMLEMQRTFTDGQEELLRTRLLRFEEEFHKAGIANADEIAFRYSTQSRELEGIYARLEGVEHGIQRGEESFEQLSKWKEKHSFSIFDLERRTSEAESQLKLLMADVEDHAQELLALLESEPGKKRDSEVVRDSSRSTSKARADEALAAATAAATLAAKEEAAEMKASAEKALSVAQELQKEMTNMFEALQSSLQSSWSPRDAWPHRNAPLVGRLPNLPPSSLAQEEIDAIRLDPQSSDLHVEFPMHKVNPLKERFHPPTGGGFRTGTSHRYRERRKRPSTAVCGVPLHSRGDAGNRPSTAR